jgi:hypothetical protein
MATCSCGKTHSLEWSIEYLRNTTIDIMRFHCICGKTISIKIDKSRRFPSVHQIWE